MKVEPISTEERFWRRVDKTSSPVGCWLWTASTSGGYGSFSVNHRKTVHAHRYSYELHHGPINDSKKHVCHHCDNRACVNPAHFFLGSNADNVRDCAKKGRLALQAPGKIRRPKGVEKGTSKLSELDVHSIRALASAGHSDKEIAANFSITAVQVGNIKHRRQWAHI